MSLEIQKRHKVLIFDSGVGGFSILNEIKEIKLSVEIDYLADTLFFPYGSRSDLELMERVPALLELVINETKPDAVIIACNTASTIALGRVRAITNIPVIGVVPAIKPAAAVSKTKVIGLLATPRTVGSAYTEDLIENFAKDCKVLRYGPENLAKAAEKYIRGDGLDKNAIIDAVDGLFNQPNGDKIDAVVLACTHYPLLKQELIKYAPHNVEWVDSGLAIAKRVANLCDLPIGLGEANLNQAFFTGGDPETFVEAAMALGFEQSTLFNF